MKLFSRHQPQPLYSFSEIEKPQPLPQRSVLPDNSPARTLSDWKEGGWLKQEREPLQEAINNVYDKLK